MASSLRGGLTDLSKPLNIGIKKHLPHHKAGAPQRNGGLNVRPVKHPLIPGRRNRERLLQSYEPMAVARLSKSAVAACVAQASIWVNNTHGVMGSTAG